MQHLRVLIEKSRANSDTVRPISSSVVQPRFLRRTGQLCLLHGGGQEPCDRWRLPFFCGIHGPWSDDAFWADRYAASGYTSCKIMLNSPRETRRTAAVIRITRQGHANGIIAQKACGSQQKNAVRRYFFKTCVRFPQRLQYVPPAFRVFLAFLRKMQDCRASGAKRG